MSQQNTGARLRGLIVDYAGIDPAKITDEADLMDDLGIDSLEKVELVMAAEDEFGIELPDDAASRIKTVEDAIREIDQASSW